MVIFALSTDVVADCPAHHSTEKRNKNEIHSPRTVAYLQFISPEWLVFLRSVRPAAENCMRFKMKIVSWSRKIGATNHF
jgi:hypothetical protein